MEKHVLKKTLINLEKNKKNSWHLSQNMLIPSTPQLSAMEVLFWAVTARKMGQEGKKGESEGV